MVYFSSSQIVLDLVKMEVRVILDFVAAYQGFKENFVKWKVRKICALLYKLLILIVVL